MNRAHLIASSRHAGQVKRYHTWPTVQGQTVAEHTFHCLRIWYHIWGAPPSEVVVHILFDDLGEIKTGDSPFPLKSDNPALRTILKQLEQQAVVDMGGALPMLTLHQIQQAKICDLIEMWEFGLNEQVMGNRFAAPIVADTRSAVEEILRAWPAETQAPVRRFISKVWGVYERCL